MAKDTLVGIYCFAKLHHHSIFLLQTEQNSSYIWTNMKQNMNGGMVKWNVWVTLGHLCITTRIRKTHTHTHTKISIPTPTHAWFSQPLRKTAFNANNLLIKRTFRLRGSIWICAAGMKVIGETLRLSPFQSPAELGGLSNAVSFHKTEVPLRKTYKLQ